MFPLKRHHVKRKCFPNLLQSVITKSTVITHSVFHPCLLFHLFSAKNVFDQHVINLCSDSCMKQTHREVCYEVLTLCTCRRSDIQNIYSPFRNRCSSLFKWMTSKSKFITNLVFTQANELKVLSQPLS